MTIHRLRLWMGWSWDELVRRAAQATVDELAPDPAAVAAQGACEREDAEELALVRSWRAACPAGQDQALELLAGVAL